MNNKIKVCHLTTVHVRYDTRIFVKECRGLAKQGYEVVLIVADGKGEEVKDGVRILDIGKPSGRIKRFFRFHKILLKKALELGADIYHFHDPELLRIAPNLVKTNSIVIYDAHEDLPRQVLDKAYIPKLIRKPLSRLLEIYEDYIVNKISGIVTVTPTLLDRFLRNNHNVVEVRNFPLISEFVENNTNQDDKGNYVCYVGAISKVRGILNMVNAMQYETGSKFLLGGRFENAKLREMAIASEGWKNVEELGFLNRDQVKEMLQKSVAGLVLLEPTPSYLECIPVKMFEYMLSGIAVIASDYPYWRELVQKENCALFVDPMNPKEISVAIKKLVENRGLAEEMGKRGRKAVLEKFNWANEEKALLSFYNKLRN
ncbi:glycosyltransferase family 4 protein [Muricauda sp. 2012CJ35-5]|uniref:Glycosyltransferase family 4 protein n=1 Tax=Flagellimonas spongiicola TaxID=2942208 RepID=A0ABT0PSB3_9FLAO|nr:glycosyltransferase family 4 protein [Allomuricauda spongiicola]MCL6274277.1 glycosyltransferase family 4 protein [Allomuricauda spongiicola]